MPEETRLRGKAKDTSKAVQDNQAVRRQLLNMLVRLQSWAEKRSDSSRKLPASWLEAEGKFLDHRVGEDFASNALHLGLLVRCRKAIFKRQQEIFSLPDIGNAFVGHAAKCIGDGFALGIEHRSFQCDVDMCLHCV